MSLMTLAIVVAGFFGIAFSAAIVVQSLVAWCTLALIGLYLGLSVVRHHSDSSFDFSSSEDRTMMLLEASALGFFFIIAANFLFSSSLVG